MKNKILQYIALVFTFIAVVSISILVFKQSKQKVSFMTTGPAFAVPAVNEKFLFVGSGFSTTCQIPGEIRAFNKNTLELVWKSQIKGSIGDTNIQLVDDLVIVGAGDGVAALNANNGELRWHKHLGGCFQESFITVDNKTIYVGSSTGTIYSLNLKGEVLWQNQLEGSVFAAPVIHKNLLFFVDMKNNIAAVQSQTGKLVWRKKFFEDEKPEMGFFSSPLINNNTIILVSRSGNILQLNLEGNIIANNSTKDGYAASPILCDDSVVVANLGSKVDWLNPNSLVSKYSIQLPEKHIFGTPQCQDKIVILTAYGKARKSSVLYYLKNGNIINSVKLPCCNNALTTSVIDNNKVYNVLTPFSLSNPDSEIKNEYNIDVYYSKLEFKKKFLGIF